MRILFILSLFILECLFIKTVWALSTNEKVWSTIGFNTQIGNYVYQIEPQLRVRDRPFLFEQLLTNFSGGYQYSPRWTMALGGTTVTTKLNQGSNLQENRVWEQVLFTHEQTPWFTLRSRLEQRTRADSNEWNYRFRERLTLRKKLTDSLSLVGFNELFINVVQADWVTTQTLDQNRILISLDQQASKNLLVGAGYLYQYVFSNPGQASHVISLYAQVTLPNEPQS
ncbi:DUF2490 domain-containing protein [Legionella hackeliae]|uniref:DUF2490 domain-containing protein n=1 Tax=Legionella hackeliae TaxID=449 RepID=A0A0A8UUB7_LEGHA|nr:DUF2490 domain-containing protein [Legionella hackeliae]KTD13948.1 hypothetical protein Lhac_0792 [Legionella hackeliae]CEK10652.1 protein of unknown function [Legionella hackeliae]STX47398.1 Protein of uncharacterised function (DUF2490) [Legionella hackeliae]